ncbi:MAG: FecR family protein [Prevotellaceae bacterium]|jgi:ferric-dicitrate binding protein FerR (iron transport regulator)|nr:FecR family protein [Prevotellaceae bacterium]
MNNNKKRWKPNVDGAWDALYARLSAQDLIHREMIHNKEVFVLRRVHPLVKWCVAALFCALCIGITAYFWPNSSSPNMEIVSVVNPNESEVLVITLPDGSVVLLSGNSQFSYPQHFSSNHREVKLNGEAFFEVAEEFGRSFIVETEYINVEVIGTSFLVRADQECLFEITVRSGSVQLSLKNEEQKLFAKAGEQVELVANLLQKSNIQGQVTVSTKEISRMHFIDEPLDHIVQILNAYGDQETLLAIQGQSLSKRTLTVSIDLGSIEEVAMLLCDALGLNMANSENIIYLNER